MTRLPLQCHGREAAREVSRHSSGVVGACVQASSGDQITLDSRVQSDPEASIASKQNKPVLKVSVVKPTRGHGILFGGPGLTHMEFKIKQLSPAGVAQWLSVNP